MGERFRLLGLFFLGGALPFLLMGGMALPFVLGLVLGDGPRVLGGLIPLVGAVYGLFLCLKTFPLPPGIQASKEQTPDLHQWLEELRRSWRTPRAGGVQLIPGGWRVDLVGPPMLGLPGWLRLRWRLGVYALLALSEREFEALAGCELVWWSDQQPWLNLQVKRIQLYWRHLAAHLDREPEPRSVLLMWPRRLLRAYARWMEELHGPFLLRELLRADQSVAQAYGSGTLARALCRLAVLPTLLKRRVFQDWSDRIKAGEPLPERLHLAIREAFLRFPEAADALLQMALADLVEEAPTLFRLRLEALGEAPAVPLPASGPRLADILLESGILDAFEREWQEDLQAQALQATANRMGEEATWNRLVEETRDGLIDHPEALDYLRLALERLEPEAFQAQLAAYREAHPEEANAWLLDIRLHLRTDRAQEAEALMEAFAKRYPLDVSHLHWVWREHHRRQGDAAAAERAWDAAERLEATERAARDERAQVGLADPMEPHGLAQDVTQDLARQLQTFPGAGPALLVRKQVQHLPHVPLLFLVVRWQGRPGAGARPMSELAARLAREIRFPVPSFGFVMVVSRRSWWMKRLERRFGPRLPQGD